MATMKITLVGGDGREQGRFPKEVAIERIAAPKYTGNGRWTSFLSSLDRGRADRIILLTRWIGHSPAGALKAAAARAGVPLDEVHGGMSMAVRQVEDLLAAAASATVAGEARPTPRGPPSRCGPSATQGRTMPRPEPLAAARCVAEGVLGKRRRGAGRGPCHP